MQSKFREILAKLKSREVSKWGNRVMKIIHGSELQFVPASHENPESPGVFKKVLAVKDELYPGRVQMVNWALLPVGAAFQRHYHEDMEEIFIILNGTVGVRVKDTDVSLAAGDTIIISPRETHEMRNLSPEPVEYIVVGISGTQNGKTVVLK